MARAIGYRDAVEFLVGYDETDLFEKYTYTELTPAVQMVMEIYGVCDLDVIDEMRLARRRLNKWALEHDRQTAPGDIG